MSRLTILSRHVPPSLGGIADHTDLLATELSRRGIAVTVVCAPVAEPREAYRVDPTVGDWRASAYRSIAGAVSATEPDVVLWQYNPFAVGSRGLAPRIGVLARYLADVAPLITYAHELWFPWGREGMRGVVWAVAQRLETRAVMRASARVIVTTEQRAAELADPARVRVIPIGANVEPAEPSDRAATRAIMGIPDTAFVVAHFGSVGPGRDLAPVLGAVEQLRGEGRDARLLLAGATGPFTPPPSVADAVVRTGIKPRVEISAALSASDVYLHPDISGAAVGRRGSLAAAYAHGLPVVAFRGPDTSPQLTDGSDVVLIEPSGTARALRTLADDPDARRRLGEAARRRYDETFAWPVVGERVIAVLRECV